MGSGTRRFRDKMGGVDAAAWFLWWEVQIVEPRVPRNFCRPPGFIFEGEGIGGDKCDPWFVEKAEWVNSEFPSYVFATRTVLVTIHRVRSPLR